MIKTFGDKTDFTPIILEETGSYLVKWGKEDEVEIVYQVDEFGELVMDENGNPIPTGEVKETPLATWWLERYFYKPNSEFLCNEIKNSGSLLVPSDIKYISEFLGEPKEETERQVRSILDEAITRYDLSDGVNVLYLNGQKVWFDKVLRTSIERQIIARKNAGQETAPIAFDGIVLQVPVDLGLQMLDQLEIYASDCYNCTLNHKTAIQTLTTDEMVNYDYTKGYPEKLSFNL